MNSRILQEAGLTKAQTDAYAALVKNSPCTPPKLATIINESRTNTYKVLEQLEDLGLVSRDETQKKLRYWANNPSLLIDSIKKKRLAAEESEKRFKDSLPALMDEYFQHSERPGIRFFQGKEGIEGIYEDQLHTAKPIHIVRSWKDRDFFGKGVYSIWRKRPAKHGIPTIMLSPDVPDANNDPELDKKLLFTRTWMDQNEYTAPVEWDIYGDRVSVISFGEEAIGMIIESPQIAESMRQMFAIMQKGLRANPEYSSLPKHGRLEDEKYAQENPEYQEIMKQVARQK